MEKLYDIIDISAVSPSGLICSGTHESFRVTVVGDPEVAADDDKDVRVGPPPKWLAAVEVVAVVMVVAVAAVVISVVMAVVVVGVVQPLDARSINDSNCFSTKLQLSP